MNARSTLPPRCQRLSVFLGAVAVAVLLAGCRTAPLGATGAHSETLAVVPLTRGASDLAETARDDFAWVRTKATYERAGLTRHAWTAAPAGGAEAAGGGGGDDLAKQSQNPIASLISVPLQNNTSFRIGAYDRTQNVLNIQPVIPVEIGRWTLINRTIIPVVVQPNTVSADQSWTGLGDINYTGFFVPPSKGKVMVGAGPVILFPTATDAHLGRRQWGIGPSAILVATLDKIVAGLLVNNIWGIGDGGTRDPSLIGHVEDINQMLIQYFVNYNLPQGWYLVSAPIITADWNRESSNRWVVPFGGGVGKVFKIGRQPVNAGVQAYYNAIRPDDSAPWSLRLQVTFLFPKK